MRIVSQMWPVHGFPMFPSSCGPIENIAQHVDQTRSREPQPPFSSGRDPNRQTIVHKASTFNPRALFLQPTVPLKLKPKHESLNPDLSISNPAAHLQPATLHPDHQLGSNAYSQSGQDVLTRPSTQSPFVDFERLSPNS